MILIYDIYTHLFDINATEIKENEYRCEHSDTKIVLNEKRSNT